MPPPEVCVIHPGALSASSWARLASHLPAGTPVKVLELETISGFWAADTELTVAELADRLQPRLAIPRERVLVGWGVGGAVADALAAPSRRVVVLDGLAPGATQPPREAELLRLFAMYAGARRGRPLEIDPAHLRAGLEPALAHILEAASASGALRVDTTPATVKRCYEQHAARVLRDHGLVAGYEPSGAPLTVVKATESIAPASPALGWDRFADVELLASGGDHYTMLTDPASAAHLAMLLRRWLTPTIAAA
jgi:thioesterase domain-containing protein